MLSNCTGTYFDISSECFNTEEMKRGISDANISVMQAGNESASGMENLESRLANSIQKKDLVAISMDVKALYPSLDWDKHDC